MERKREKLSQEGVHRNSKDYFTQMKTVVKGSDTVPFTVVSSPVTTRIMIIRQTFLVLISLKTIVLLTYGVCINFCCPKKYLLFLFTFLVFVSLSRHWWSQIK